jgi:hypothetical protein
MICGQSMCGRIPLRKLREVKKATSHCALQCQLSHMQRIFDTRVVQEPQRAQIQQVATQNCINASTLLHQAGIGACKFRRTSSNTAFHDAHSKWNPCEIMPRRYISHSRRAGGMHFSAAPRYCRVPATPVLGNVSPKSSLMLLKEDPQATKTEDIRFQAAFTVQPGRNGLWPGKIQWIYSRPA